MTLKELLKTIQGRDAKASFATRCGTTLNYLRLVAYGAKKASAELAINIERESFGQVRAESLRPDVDWAAIRQRKA